MQGSLEVSSKVRLH